MDENCHVEPIYKDAASADQILRADLATLAIWGMGCENCATRVRNSLLLLEGVYGVDVYLNMAVAEVRYDREKISPTEFAIAVSRAGNDGRHEYRAELIAMQ
jgi:copper chaperone CopZ